MNPVCLPRLQSASHSIQSHIETKMLQCFSTGKIYLTLCHIILLYVSAMFFVFYVMLQYSLLGQTHFVPSFALKRFIFEDM